MNRTIKQSLQLALALGALSLAGCATLGDTYIESRPYIRASIDDASFEARNFSTVEGSISIDPVTGAHTVAVKADRDTGWTTIGGWVVALLGFAGGGK